MKKKKNRKRKKKDKKTKVVIASETHAVVGYQLALASRSLPTDKTGSWGTTGVDPVNNKVGVGGGCHLL